MPIHHAKTSRQQESIMRSANAAPVNSSLAKSSSNETEVSSMQRTMGNRAVGQLMNSQSAIQTKLTVGPVGDAYEQEADRVGKQVADQISAGEAAVGAPSSVQRMEAEGAESEEEALQMKPEVGAIQRMGAEGAESEEEELQMKPEVGAIQRMGAEGAESEEEELQMKPEAGAIQRMEAEGAESEEEALQMKPEVGAIQRMEAEGAESEEEALQMKPEAGAIQRMEAEGAESEEEALQMKPEAGGIQRMGGEEEEPLQMKSSGEGFDAAPDIESDIKSMQGSGSKMDGQIQAKMESAFGADFSGVNIHTGGKASQLTESLGAEAFATGSDIFFRAGNYNPDSREGQELLGHELTHVIQQRGGS
ncbi:eCIS core domain-containing protein [Paenibacillus hexagrammi]|uniref:DUF4157 domain-containing protein n=1 Tax=Paenibacillus hexagrammi TaxID=2908839 RepID=A0ABY3SKV9_9BACL|nr:DUF4157 domain-containing protein [Paenibacillus sp. YPD9-1]UJF34108.1 DUF4157 domain-containing protein [Paenibacillus sp. YPD9-1]